jgi:hypothetical protein
MNKIVECGIFDLSSRRMFDLRAEKLQQKAEGSAGS